MNTFTELNLNEDPNEKAHEELEKLRRFQKILETGAAMAGGIGVLALILLGLAKMFLADQPFVKHIETFHFVIATIDTLGFGALLAVLHYLDQIVGLLHSGIKLQLEAGLGSLSPTLEKQIGTQLGTLNPFFSIVSDESHQTLFTFSTALLHTAGELISAIGAGTVDYENPAFAVLQKDYTRHYAEFVYYWIIETILSLNADRIRFLKMAHYIPATGFYPIFIKRFQDAQRRMDSSVEIKKIYRFRDKSDYNRKAFEESDALEWSRQVPFSELLIEEGPKPEILVEYGVNNPGSLGEYIDEIIVIRLISPGCQGDKERRLHTRIVAVAAKDVTNFQFHSGKIHVGKE